MTLRTILGRVNPYVNDFVCAVDCFAANPTKEVHICITTSDPPETPKQKHFTTEDIDRLVSAELLLLENAPLFETVTKCLLHGPCGQKYPNTPCMVNSVCKKCYPQAFFEETTQGKDGYPIYR
jgi:hypothetical protein